MIIRKPEDMTAVLGLIQELADFEKEPDAVITVDDLVRDGFGPSPLFHVLAEVASEIGIAVLLSLLYLER
jgi:uncharacterized protein with PhoU and TrkA domain